MTKGKTKSKKTLKERKEEAFRKFAQGATVIEVARDLKVSRQTAASYKRKYEESLEAEAIANPRLLQDVLKNTIRSLRELDIIRRDAWDRLEAKPQRIDVSCPECEADFAIKVNLPPGDQARVQYQNVLLKAADQRSKLFGIMGVKHEVFVAITNVQLVQSKMLEWMGRNLCAQDREALAQFLETDLREFMPGEGVIGAIDVESFEVPIEA